MKRNKKLKIAFVLDDTLDRNAGAQVYVLTLGDHLEKLGHNVSYIVGETKKKVRSNQYSLAKNLKVKFNGNHLSVPLHTSKKEVKELLRNEQFDIVHIQSPFSPIMAGKVMKVADGHSRIIGTFHILPYGAVATFSNYIFGLWLRLYNKYFDAFLTISEPSQEFSKKYYGITGPIIRYPVNLSQIKKITKKKLNRQHSIELLFHGRLVERKGCLELLKAFAYANENKLLKKDCFLHISGDGPDKQKLKKFVKNNNLTKFVKFHGRTTDEQKFQLMQLSDITIYPAMSGESFGVVTVEAMATAHPIVLAGNNPGYASVLSEAKDSLFDSKNTPEFARHIAKYVNNKRSRDSLFKLQQKLVKKYDVKLVAKQVLELYYGDSK